MNLANQRSSWRWQWIVAGMVARSLRVTCFFPGNSSANLFDAIRLLSEFLAQVGVKMKYQGVVGCEAKGVASSESTEMCWNIFIARKLESKQIFRLFFQIICSKYQGALRVRFVRTNNMWSFRHSTIMRTRILCAVLVQHSSLPEASSSTLLYNARWYIKVSYFQIVLNSYTHKTLKEKSASHPTSFMSLHK